MEDGRQRDQQRISALERRVGALERELQELRQSVIDNSNIRIQHASASASTTPVNTSNNDSHANINAISERNGSAEDGAEQRQSLNLRFGLHSADRDEEFSAWNEGALLAIELLGTALSSSRSRMVSLMARLRS